MKNTTIWVDGDACPKPVKEIIVKTAIRKKRKTVFVANKLLTLPLSSFIQTVVVGKTFDAADHYIISHLQANDLVITADIPLAAEVICQHALALNPRGHLYTEKDIKQRLSMRNMMEQIRSTGEKTGHIASFSIKEKTAFANALDKWLTKLS